MEAATTVFSENVVKTGRITAKSVSTDPLDEPILLSSQKPAARRDRKAGFVRQIAVLAVGISAELDYPGAVVTRAASPREVIELLRMSDYRLLVVGAADDRQIWNVVSLVRRHRPGLPWALVRQAATDRDEILARSLGAIAVGADVAEIIRGLMNRINGLPAGN